MPSPTRWPWAADADVAQPVERRICNPKAVGSSPTVSSVMQLEGVIAGLRSPISDPDSFPGDGPGPDGGVPKRSNGADCKSAG